MMEQPGTRATVVSDLVAYFRKETRFRHYRICCSLRSKIDEALSQRANASNVGRLPLFVILEQETECETPLDEGTCYVVDQEMVTGGRAVAAPVAGSWLAEADDVYKKVIGSLTLAGLI